MEHLRCVPVVWGFRSEAEGNASEAKVQVIAPRCEDIPCMSNTCLIRFYSSLE